MTLKEIVFEPKAVIEFTAQEVKVLMELSARHYDGVCQNLGQWKGAIYGMNNEATECGQSTIERTMRFREIDLLAKVCEIAGMCVGDGPEDRQLREIGSSLHFKCLQILTRLNQVPNSAELLEALEEIAKGEGRFSLDHKEHAQNTIEDMKAVAAAAIKKAKGQ